MKVHIGLIIAHGFPVPAQFFKSFTLMQNALLTSTANRQWPASQVTGVRLTICEDFPIDHARNKVCRLFLDEDTDADYLLFLDTDMTHPPDLAHRLLRHRKDVVTGRYVMRKPPFFSVAMRKVGDGPEDYQAIEKLVPPAEVRGLMPVDAGGAGALLISRWVLERMRKEAGDDWFRYQDGPDGKRSRSEDMWFYEHAARHCQPFLDADAWCGHIAQFEVDPKYHEPYADAFVKARAAQEREEVWR